MPSALGGQGISAAMAGYSNRNAMLANAISQVAQNQQFRTQIQEQREAEQRQRKAQEKAQKEAEKKQGMGAMMGGGGAALGATIGAILAAPVTGGTSLMAVASALGVGSVGLGTLGGAALGAGIGGAAGMMGAGAMGYSPSAASAAGGSVGNAFNQAYSMQNQQQQLGMQQQELGMRQDNYADMAAWRKESNRIKDAAAIAKTTKDAGPKNNLITTGNLSTLSQIAGNIIPASPENKQVAEWALGYALQNIKNQQAGIRDTIGGPPPPDYGTGELGASVRDAVPFQQPQVPLGDRLNWRPRDQYGEWTGEPGTPQLGASPQQAPMTEDERITEEIKRRRRNSPSASPYGYRPRF